MVGDDEAEEQGENHRCGEAGIETVPASRNGRSSAPEPETRAEVGESGDKANATE